MLVYNSLLYKTRLFWIKPPINRGKNSRYIFTDLFVMSTQIWTIAIADKNDQNPVRVTATVLWLLRETSKCTGKTKEREQERKRARHTYTHEERKKERKLEGKKERKGDNSSPAIKQKYSHSSSLSWSRRNPWPFPLKISEMRILVRVDLSFYLWVWIHIILGLIYIQSSLDWYVTLREFEVRLKNIHLFSVLKSSLKSPNLHIAEKDEMF